MRLMGYWVVLCGGLLVLTGNGCTVKQQQEVLGGVGALIPGSRNSLVYPESSSSPSSQGNGAEAKIQTATVTSQTTTASTTQPPPPPVPRNDLGTTDAQLVLQTMQRAMKDNPTPFLECLNDTPCRGAFTTHLIRLQKLAGGQLELPPVYDRYDLQRGKE
jgi:hypothetical protein